MSLPKDTLLDYTKFKAFADDIENVAKIMISLLDRIGNIVGKEENAGNQHFLLFPKCYLNASSIGFLKVGLCGKGSKG